MKYKNLIFDMDDTLLPCGKFYIDCISTLVDYQHNRTGISKDVCKKIVSCIDVACTATPVGFSKERFPRSFAATSSAIDLALGNPPDPEAWQESYNLGRSVYDAPYDIFEGVSDMLIQYASVGYRLFLLSKGDLEIQQSKIMRNLLHQIFQSNRVYIVHAKTGECIEKIITEHGLNKQETIMIGDSIKDDIGSAVSAGIDSVLVDHNRPEWAYEDVDHTPTHHLQTILDLPTLIPV